MPRTRTVGSLSLPLAAALLAITAAAGGCTSETDGSAAGSTASRASDTATTMTLPDATGAVPTGASALKFGDGLPRALVQLPGGYTVEDARLVRPAAEVPESEWHALSAWEIAGVYPHPCDGTSMLASAVGPSVGDLAEALAAQPLRAATDPVPVRVAGYEGMYVELSVPNDIDLEACARGKFFSWTDTEGGDRWQQGPGQLDRLWILDVDGHRLVLDATALPGASEQQIAALTEMVDTIAFTEAS